jgi:anti-sigma factor RsiW
MNCRQAERVLTRAMDGELPAAERAGLEEHLRACRVCRATEAAWREAGGFLRAQEVPTPPPDVMWADVQRAIRQAEAQPRATGPLLGWRLGWATAIVMAMFVGMVGLATWRQRERVEARALAATPQPQVEWAEAEMPGATTMVYEDEESGLAVIWLLSAENELETPKGT